jgi:hypothetical protein
VRHDFWAEAERYGGGPDIALPRDHPGFEFRCFTVDMDVLLNLVIDFFLFIQHWKSIAHGTRHIIAEMNKAGYRISTILLTGGLSKNPLFVQEHADVTNCHVVISNEPDSMLLGTRPVPACFSPLLFS